MTELYSDVIEVRLASGHDGLEVLQNQKTLSFSEQSWMDLNSETLIYLTTYEEVINLIPLIKFLYVFPLFIAFDSKYEFRHSLRICDIVIFSLWY